MKRFLRPATLVIALAFAWIGLSGHAHAAPVGSQAAGISSSEAAVRADARSIKQASPASAISMDRPGTASFTIAAVGDIRPGNAGANVPASIARSPVAAGAGVDPDDANAGRVSEPGTYALMLAGLLLMGFIVRRRTR